MIMIINYTLGFDTTPVCGGIDTPAEGMDGPCRAKAAVAVAAVAWGCFDAVVSS
jgi:hypothetical protein